MNFKYVNKTTKTHYVTFGNSTHSEQIQSIHTENNATIYMCPSGTNIQLMKLSKAIFGEKLFGLIMKSTFYGHFVAGEDRHKIVPTLERLHFFLSFYANCIPVLCVYFVCLYLMERWLWLIAPWQWRAEQPPINYEDQYDHDCSWNLSRRSS